VGGAEEAAAQTVDRLARKACAFGELVAARVHEVRDGAHSAGGLALKVSAPARRPQEHDRGDPRPGREAPALEPVRNRGVRRRNRHGQDEREDRRGRGRREVTADHAREEDAEADGCHRAGGQPGISRAEGPERDEDGADARKPRVRDEASQRRATELDEHEYRERSEGREDRRLRLLDHLVCEREDRRHDDRSARGALQRCQVGHGCR